WQACVRVSGYERVGYSAEFSDVGPQFLRPEGTVKPYGKRPCMAYRVPEGLRRLPGKRAAGEIGNRAGDHDGQGFLPFFKELVDREESRPGVQGIENGFDQKQIRATPHQPFGRLAIVSHQLVEGHV